MSWSSSAQGNAPASQTRTPLWGRSRAHEDVARSVRPRTATSGKPRAAKKAGAAPKAKVWRAPSMWERGSRAILAGPPHRKDRIEYPAAVASRSECCAARGERRGSTGKQGRWKARAPPVVGGMTALRPSTTVPMRSMNYAASARRLCPFAMQGALSEAAPLSSVGFSRPRGRRCVSSHAVVVHHAARIQFRLPPVRVAASQSKDARRAHRPHITCCCPAQSASPISEGSH